MIQNRDSVREYIAIVNQTGTNAPVVTILKNTLGSNLIWARVSAGNYTGTLETLDLNTEFTLLNTTTITGGDGVQQDMTMRVTFFVLGVGAVSLRTFSAGVLSDGWLVNQTIIIRKYGSYENV